MVGKIFSCLLRHFGPQHWWPTSWKNKRDEIIIGAILTQNTAWSNVEKALKNLSEAGIRSLEKIASCPQKTLARLIKPAGYFNQKAKKLKLVAKFFRDHPDFARYPLSRKRKLLLRLWGIGEETADSILLYAFNEPSFVVDAYTRRIFYRLKLISRENEPYLKIADLVKSSAPKHKKERVRFLQEFHALLVELGKNYCLKSKTNCQKCPLRFCPNRKNC